MCLLFSGWILPPSYIMESIESFSTSWLSSENIRTTMYSVPHETNNSPNHCFNFRISGITDHHPCYADQLFSNGLIRTNCILYPDTDNVNVDYYFSSATALKQPVSLDRACVCPTPPVMPPPLRVNRRQPDPDHHAVSRRKKSLLKKFLGSLNKFLVKPFHCGIRVDDIDTRAALEEERTSAVGKPSRSSADGWIIEFENPIYEAILHCKRSPSSGTYQFHFYSSNWFGCP